MSDQVMNLQAQLASLKAQAAQGQAGVMMQEDAKGYMAGAAAELLGYVYPGAPAAEQPCAYGGNGGHDAAMSALLGSDYMQQSLYHAFEQAGAADDDGMQAAAAESSSF